MKEGYVKTQESPEVFLHYVEEFKDPDAPVVVLLHGFPEFWYAWKDYLTPLSDLGFHPVAVDLRGYNRSTHQAEQSEYELAHLVQDVKAVVEMFGRKAFIVGHDWGGIITWEFAAKHPESCEGIVVVNAPHPQTFSDNFTLKQALKSWYTVFFQLPRLPEFMLRRRNFKMLENIFRHQSQNQQAYPQEDLEMYKAAFEQDLGIRSALDYYRANMKNFSKRREAMIRVPTLLVWGEKDAALETNIVKNIEDYVSGPLTKRFYPEASHWIHREIPAELVRVFANFFRSVST